MMFDMIELLCLGQSCVVSFENNIVCCGLKRISSLNYFSASLISSFFVSCIYIVIRDKTLRN